MHDTKVHNAAPLLLVTGFVIGAITALLITPKSGDDMRKNLKESIDNMKQRTKDSSSTVRDPVNDTTDQVKPAVRLDRPYKNEQQDQGDNIVPMP